MPCHARLFLCPNIYPLGLCAPQYPGVYAPYYQSIDYSLQTYYLEADPSTSTTAVLSSNIRYGVLILACT